MDGWSVGLWAVAMYVAVMALVRLMLARRDKLVSGLQEQAAEQQRQLQQKREQDDEEEEAA